MIMQNNLFFFIKTEEENQNFLFLKTKNFFKKVKILFPSKNFIYFNTNKINFDLLKKYNDVFLFFTFDNTFYFKDHIKYLQIYLLKKKNKIKLNNLFLIFYSINFFNKFLFIFVFVLKKISIIKY